MMQVKMASCKEKQWLCLEKKTPGASDYKVEPSVAIEEVQILAPAVLVAEAGPNLLGQSCLPQACSGHVFTTKTARLYFAAKTELMAREAVRPQFQFGQKDSKVGFLIEPQASTDTLLETKYSNENIEIICLKNHTINLTCSSPDAMQKSVGTAV